MTTAFGLNVSMNCASMTSCPRPRDRSSSMCAAVRGPFRYTASTSPSASMPSASRKRTPRRSQYSTISAGASPLNGASATSTPSNIASPCSSALTLRCSSRPTIATLQPSMPPSSRFNVYRSASAWVGWSSAEPPLTTGRASTDAARSITPGSPLRTTTASILRLASSRVMSSTNRAL